MGLLKRIMTKGCIGRYMFRRRRRRRKVVLNLRAKYASEKRRCVELRVAGLPVWLKWRMGRSGFSSSNTYGGLPCYLWLCHWFFWQLDLITPHLHLQLVSFFLPSSVTGKLLPALLPCQVASISFFRVGQHLIYLYWQACSFLIW